MKKVILIVLCLWAFPVAASHIVGGEFELIHISGSRYRVNLILYFDKKNGSAGARDASVDARIFRKRGNALMMDVHLVDLSETPVDYSQPACSDGELVTSRIVYTTIITLSPSDFSDPEGYYLAWERCCRNYGITNVYSEDPLSRANYAGQTFYLEFPPVVVNGQPFINSSPRLFQPLSDYGCPYRPYYVDFGGVDDDGDSLAYSLITPLNTKSPDALPLPDYRPRPGPYPFVNYRESFGPDNIMGGAPDLKITTDGFLTVTPTINGLFVFAVKCEEYRDGIKIGELRRDFQLLVDDKCGPAVAPKILGKKLTDASFSYDDQMTVTFSNDVADTERCIQVQITDDDVLRADDSFMENITLRAIPLGFKKDVSGVLPAVTAVTLLKDDPEHTFDICFDRCPLLQEGPFRIGVVAYDDACSLPLTDTLTIIVDIEPPHNSHARFISPDVNESVAEGVSKSWSIAAVDDDNDPLTVTSVTDGFDLNAVGMGIELISSVDGSYEAKLVWNPDCELYDFGERDTFHFTLLVDDADECHFSNPDVMEVHLTVDLPENAPPVISSDLTTAQLEGGIPQKIFEPLSFKVFGEDGVDNNHIKLMAQGNVFDLAAYNMQFPPASGQGYAESQFDWPLSCDDVDLSDKDEFELLFIAVDDANKCSLYMADTLTVKIKVLPPDNLPPILTVASTNPDLPFVNHQQTLFPGQQISLGLTGMDGDVAPQDHLVVDLIGATGTVPPEGYVFEKGQGVGSAQTNFTWLPDCSIFHNGVYENEYAFRFLTYDDRCYSEAGDTVEVNMTIRDRSREDIEFLPPNFVSADHDPKMRNEFFAMVKLKDAATGELEEILPPDNCVGRFIGITIFSRWGTPVFESNRRDFRWYPDDDASGVYFYTLTFSDKKYKGTITVRN